MIKVCDFCGKSCEYSAWVYGDKISCSDCKEVLVPLNEKELEKIDNEITRRRGFKEFMWTAALCILLIVAAIVYVLVKPS